MDRVFLIELHLLDIPYFFPSLFFSCLVPTRLFSSSSNYDDDDISISAM